jgi:uncharacterized membrane protein YidH (DUF202 family)
MLIFTHHLHQIIIIVSSIVISPFGFFFLLTPTPSPYQIYTRRVDAARPGYHLLGVLMLIQLMTVGLLAAKDALMTWYRTRQQQQQQQPAGHRLAGYTRLHCFSTQW